MKIKLLVALLLMFNESAFAGSGEPRFGDEKAIKEAKKKAVVKIIHEYHDGRKEEGTGTFIGKGLIITNYHVMKAYLEGKTKSTRVLDWRGGAASKVSIGNCGGQNQDIDLCVIKVEGLELQYPFALYEREVRSTYDIVGYGYCMSKNNLSSWEGKVLNKIENTGESVRDYGSKINRNTQTYEVSMKNCHGSSGGPVFDPMSGKLVAIFSRYYYSDYDKSKSLDTIMKNAKFTVITSLEIDNFVKASSEFREIASEKINKERYLADPFMP
ncbi:MAG: hypothetical protein OHK0056_33260 [Bacteriovoracaceae bacterium]